MNFVCIVHVLQGADPAILEDPGFSKWQVLRNFQTDKPTTKNSEGGFNPPPPPAGSANDYHELRMRGCSRPVTAADRSATKWLVCHTPGGSAKFGLHDRAPCGLAIGRSPPTPTQARIQGFFWGCSAPPLRLSAIFFLYSNPQMLIFPCPLNFIVVFSLPN